MDSPGVGGAESNRDASLSKDCAPPLDAKGPRDISAAPHCPTSMAGIQVSYFRPIDALADLAGDLAPNSPEYQALQTNLKNRPGFLRVSEADLLKYAKNFEHVVNITGYSGQGIHPGQRRLLQEAFAAITADKKWESRNTLLISGGTALGIPDSAVNILAGREHFPAAAVMALPGVAYPLTDGYIFVCAEDHWKNWGDETAAMGRVATETILAGGGVQAFEDALLAARDEEPVAVIVNTYNSSARLEYVLGEKHGDVIIKADGPAILPNSIIRLSEIEQSMRAALVRQGMTQAEAEGAHLCSLPVSGLVTEIKNGQRRACGQDLLYFAITGNGDLLPKKFQSSSPNDVERLRLKLVQHLDLYYLFDDPYEDVHSSAITKLNEALRIENIGLLERVIDHAVMHDVSNPATGHCGPAALGAHNQEELALVLKQSLRKQLSHVRSHRARAG